MHQVSTTAPQLANHNNHQSRNIKTRERNIMPFEVQTKKKRSEYFSKILFEINKIQN